MKRESQRLLAMICLLAVMPISSYSFAQSGSLTGKSPVPIDVGLLSAGTFKYFGAKYFSKVVKGAPYSAIAITEHIQTLGDGNQIVRKNEAKVYRDGEGRTRFDQKLNTIGKWTAAGDAPQMVYINDPVTGFSYNLDPGTRTVRKSSTFKYATLNQNINDEKRQRVQEERVREQEKRVREHKERVNEQTREHEERVREHERESKERIKEHQERVREHEERTKERNREHEIRAKERNREHEARTREHEIRAKERNREHEIRTKQHETRIREHQERMKQLTREHESRMKQLTREYQGRIKEHQEQVKRQSRERDAQMKVRNRENELRMKERNKESEKRLKEQTREYERRLKEQTREYEKRIQEHQEHLKFIEKRFQSQEKTETSNSSIKTIESAARKEILNSDGRKEILNADSRKKIESLGKQTIEGINAEGTRAIRAIPAGEIGNTMPIEVVEESWYSPDLQVLVMTKHNDPRSGITTYRLSNIQRSEPERSLFEVPVDYISVQEKKLVKVAKIGEPAKPIEPGKKPVMVKKPDSPTKGEPGKKMELIRKPQPPKKVEPPVIKEMYQ
jgi:hypothetical protein